MSIKMWWTLLLLAVSVPCFGERIVSIGLPSDSHRSDPQGSTVSPGAQFNKTQHELRDAMFDPWNGPSPRFAQFPSTEIENLAKVGYAEIMLLAQAALLGICKRDVAFRRYFQDVEADRVRKVFEQLLGPNGNGPPEVADVGWPMSILYADRASAGATQNSCDLDPAPVAFTFNFRYDERGSAIALCPKLFTRTSESAKLFLQDWDCHTIPAYAAWAMYGVGPVLLHEFMHWNVITYKAARLFILDYGLVPGRIASTPNDGHPPNGYGSFNAWQLNVNANGADKQPSTNADSYAWFALESYWSYKCGRDFQDPPSREGSQLIDYVENIQQEPAPPPPDPAQPTSSALNPEAPPFQATPSTST